MINHLPKSFVDLAIKLTVIAQPSTPVLLNTACRQTPLQFLPFYNCDLYEYLTFAC